MTLYQPMTIVEMSDTGALIETDFALHLASLHEFRLSLGELSVVVKGRIVHSQIGELGEVGARYRTGLEFVEPSDHALAAIRAFVEAHRAAGDDTPPRVVDAEIAD